jgi:hypothetical protein
VQLQQKAEQIRQLKERHALPDEPVAETTTLKGTEMPKTPETAKYGLVWPRVDGGADAAPAEHVVVAFDCREAADAFVRSRLLARQFGTFDQAQKPVVIPILPPSEAVEQVPSLVEA